MTDLPPINEAMLDHAARIVRRTLDCAHRDDEKAKRDLLRFAAADALETKLMRVAAFADSCCPTLDEIKLNRGSFSADAVRLRFELEGVDAILGQAAGRAVVVDIAQVKASVGDDEAKEKQPEDAA